MSGEWPPDWEDPDEVFPDQDEQLGEDTGARLSEVSAFLATVPAPGLPDSVAARISAAIAAEAAARAGDSGQSVENSSPVENAQAVDNRPPGDRRAAGDNAQPVDNPTTRLGAEGARTLGRAPARARVRRRPFSPRKFLVAAPVLVVCLLFAGIGYAISHSPSSSSSSAASGAAAPAATAPADSASGTSAAGDRTAAGAVEPPPFTVTDSGTRYERATLAGQVRGALAGTTPSAAGTGQPAPASSGAAGSAASSGQSPSPELLGCVRHFTGGSPPKLVDRGTYQGTPAYVIASSSHVWVVGLGCSAANPELITSAPLEG